MTVLFAVLLGVFLAYANGANDNFKGVATLFGSGTTDYRRALVWGTACTFFGSLISLTLTQGLLVTFSGKGLVPDSVVTMKSFSIAVILASALTVMLATKLGFPISTTHSLTGALVGAGWLASTSGINLSKLGSSFFVSLVAGPLMATLLAVVVYPAFRFARAWLGVEKETCVCVGTEVVAIVPLGMVREQALAIYQSVPSQLSAQTIPTVGIGTEAICQERYTGRLLGINARATLNSVHFLSAGVVSFARGLNDTPKIAALLLVGGTFSPTFTIVSVSVAMAIGGLVNAKKIAETMAHRVTAMNTGQGFTANLITSFIVIFASKLGLPVSTTHVSCGALFGIGIATGQAHWKTIAGITVTWVMTLPIAACLGALIVIGMKGVLE